MTDTDTTNQPEQPSQLVDRVRIELARRRALAEALHPPKRRPQATPGVPIAKRPPRRAS